MTTAPTFTVARNAGLWGRVWPGDFNGDGITDLAASAPRSSVLLANTLASDAVIVDVDHDGKKDVVGAFPFTTSTSS